MIFVLTVRDETGNDEVIMADELLSNVEEASKGYGDRYTITEVPLGIEEFLEYV